MLKRAFIFCFYCLCWQLKAQPLAVPEVPHKMNFAGITLTIRDDARREIQKDVDALMQSPKHYQIKVERAKAYFPIIEKIFAEEKLPDDFKYLVLQESALIGNAVSVSNAVGFWQFKDFTAKEVGMRVDDLIDERMNIVSATRGAARYIKKNNYQFNNWIYALQSYQMGAGGVLRSVPDVESGARHMTITSQTYWYVKKFLAHKVAFEVAMQNQSTSSLKITEVSGIELEKIISQTSLSEEKLRSLNLWIRKNYIPDDKTYALILPNQVADNSLISDAPKVLTKQNSKPTVPIVGQTSLHGLAVTYSQSNETLQAIAQRNNVSLPSFMRYNDLHGFEKVMPNIPYYLQPKNKSSNKSTVSARAGQDLWQISQQEGIRLKTLKKLNRKKTLTLEAGEVVWLSGKKPKVAEQPSKQWQASEFIKDIPETHQEYFNWEILIPTESENKLQVETVPIQIQDIQPNVQKSKTIVPQTIPVDGKHEVRAGETLYSISKQYGISAEEITNINQLKNNAIQPGQILILIKPNAEKDLQKSNNFSFIWHEVKTGESLYSVARQYGVTIKELCDWNGKKDFEIKPGEKLRIEKVE